MPLHLTELWPGGAYIRTVTHSDEKRFNQLTTSLECLLTLRAVSTRTFLLLSPIFAMPLPLRFVVTALFFAYVLTRPFFCAQMFLLPNDFLRFSLFFVYDPSSSPGISIVCRLSLSLFVLMHHKGLMDLPLA